MKLVRKTDGERWLADIRDIVHDLKMAATNIPWKMEEEQLKEFGKYVNELKIMKRQLSATYRSQKEDIAARKRLAKLSK